MCKDKSIEEALRSGQLKRFSLPSKYSSKSKGRQTMDVLNKYCLVRSEKAGVFAGEIIGLEANTVLIKNSRRLWYWDGAATLSQLAQEGVKRPGNCKFPCEIPEHLVFGVIEIIPCSEEAQISIKKVKVWEE